ncbi:piwi-like protein Ago3 [Paramacrobiotus metropolitanus]|uniref:piwi-like protein Ago3 n=1 Tax=Paramacrobiotus metropolitanus TaxID=2943436 RepID=UPI0024463339|nr:piwi-like protein Ago3 [Paramacrobiotus metropolitanus]XP_055330040.1 piwi-like protein Ago3 [Paramacrobiotus metropolitanus]
MDQRPGAGRGIGRGRGIPAPVQPSQPAPAQPSQPVPAAQEQIPTPGIGRGRGRGLGVTQQPPTPTSPASVTSAPAFPSVSQPAPQAPVAGRGIGRRGVPRAGETGLGSADAAGASSAPSIPGPRGDAAARAMPAPQSAASGIEAGMARMDISAPQRQPAAVPAAQAGGSGPPPTGKAEERPEELHGEEAVNAERERRQRELRIIPKPIGTVGRRVELVTNAVHFQAAPESMVYEYRVDFEPQLWSARLRIKLIESLANRLPPTYLFDFDNLFLSQRLPNEVEEFVCPSPYRGPEGEIEEYKLTIRFVMSNRANESKELLNLVLKNLELSLNFVQIGKNRFDPVQRIAIREAPNVPAMEVWPGFQTSVNPYSAGILLLTDAQFRVIRTGNVKDLMDMWRSEAGSNDAKFRQLIMDNLIGATVLTPYNNRSYVVSDIRWDMSPLFTFKNSKGEECVFWDYYRQHYNITIVDKDQPLMYSKPAPTGNKRREGFSVALIPELCQLTGIQDDLRANFAAMKTIAIATKLNPQQRAETIKGFLRDLDRGQEAQKILQTFGVKISKELLRVPGRVLQREQLFCGQSPNPVTVPENGDWTRNATGGKLMDARGAEHWTLIFQKRDQKCAEDFARAFRDASQSFGMQFGNPQIMMLTADQNITYANSIAKAAVENKSKLVVTIFPNMREDRYAAVKQSCYMKHGIASQVIMSRTLGRPDRLRAIVQKIALQINCKLGGSIWRMAKMQLRADTKKDPMSLMVIGVDAYHDIKRRKDSIAALVASTDDDFTHWHSRCNFQPPKTELASGIKFSFACAMISYARVNRAFPNTIVIFRDGLSDAELGRGLLYEVGQILSITNDPRQLLDMMKNDSSSSSSESSQEEVIYVPEIYYIVVQKRINQRLFLSEKNTLVNPKPGTVCDEGITRRDMYDFYLVPQNVREGSVSPVHFIVCYQPPEPRLTVDDIQGLAYKLTHMYYNWTGTIRVPAPCMYAHKLAYQSGTCYERAQPDTALLDTLFYL